jgi:hypothetical protein
MLFSQLRTEFSGLLDPRKMGALDFGSTASWPAVWVNTHSVPAHILSPIFILREYCQLARRVGKSRTPAVVLRFRV